MPNDGRERATTQNLVVDGDAAAAIPKLCALLETRIVGEMVRRAILALPLASGRDARPEECRAVRRRLHVRLGGRTSAALIAHQRETARSRGEAVSRGLRCLLRVKSELYGPDVVAAVFAGLAGGSHGFGEGTRNGDR